MGDSAPILDIGVSGCDILDLIVEIANVKIPGSGVIRNLSS